MTLNEAIRAAKLNVTNQYAQSYLREIAAAIDMGGTEGLRVQLLYALNNMRGWRGAEAREAKAVMRAYIEENS